ncbi:hypothetical protein [Fulvivirga sediminis]|uniref:Glycosyltransferase 2-like domain-containing protein n=1 Tax=Fulvivirga sediminis TaxID=2803949 RepID=A0A937K3J0_9BACT|nr:hypothetical protein [Fulvivirga sediminis]MBL3659037.1 hypothetical protein [Fulvivirga sediminis]
MIIEYIIDKGFAFIGLAEDTTKIWQPLKEISELVNFDYVIVLEGELLPHVDDVLESESLYFKEDFVIFLTDRKEPPKVNGQDHGPVRSFICSSQIFNIHYCSYKDHGVDEWAYYLLHLVYNKAVSPEKLEVRQLPLKPIRKISEESLINVIIPHKGDCKDLNSCLNCQLKSEFNRQNILVGFDEYKEDTDHQLVSHWGAEVSFYQANPPNVGPYVIRESLINKCDRGLLTFVDSDDLSCTDRLNVLAGSLNEQIRMVGSHELRFDVINKHIRAIRYPLNVSEALDIHTGFPLLHSTALMYLEDFERVGGYSTNRKFANDTQFLLRSYFYMNISNVDEFLYIRKTHPKSLTAGKTDPLSDEIRTKLANQWNTDFEKIRNEKLGVMDSSLAPIKVDKNELTRVK